MQANRKRVRLTGLICLMSLMLVAAITGCVKVVPATGITLDQSTLTVEVGSTARLRATVEPEDVLDSRVYWDTSDASVATVDSRGKVTGIAEGTAVISAETSDARYYAECTVTVIAAGLVWDGDTPSEQPDGFDTPDPDDPEADPNLIVINDTQALAYFAAQVNAGNSYSGKTVRLGRDLDLNNQAWTPIGRSGSAFSGTFDGNGMTLSNLYVENTESEFAGLFGMLNTGTVKNLNVHNASVKGLSSVGVIAGGYTGKIENCHVTGLIQVEGSYKVGGIIGYAYATVTDSSVAGDEGSYVRGTYLEADLEGDNVGGVIGFVGEGSKTYSGLSASITVEGTRKVGGVIGYLSADVSAEGLSYTGSVSTNATGEYLLENASRIMVGGLVGEYAANTSLKNSAVTDSTVTGASAACTGALIGGTRNVNNVLIQSGNTQTNVTVVIRAEIADGFCLVAEGYEVSNLNGFKYFRDAVNAGTSYQGKTVLLACDIDLNNEEWTPIGKSGATFQGTFDGQNHTIFNLKIDKPTTSDVGLFGYTTTPGVLKNFTVENADVKGYLDVGAIAGTPYNAGYENITLKGLVKVEGFAYVGGMFGKNVYHSLTGLTIQASEGSYVKAESQNYRTYVGGMIGFMGEGSQTISDVVSNIDVYGSTCDVGGITGIAHYGNTFENITCTGNVYVTNSAYEENKLEIGGIAGVWLNSASGNVTFNNCSFTGTLSSYYAVENRYLDESEFAYGGLIGSKYDLNSSAGKLFIDGYEFYADGIRINNDVYEIYSEAGLFSFAADVNAGNSYSGKTVVLTADLDLEGESWTPIGDSVASYPSVAFAGTFDGRDHTISNLTINRGDNTDTYAADGLFGALVGKVKNVTLKNAVITGTHYVGAIAGYSSANVGMAIENCHVDGAELTSVPVMIGDSYDNGDKVGGIIGYCVSGDQITGCTVTDTVIKGYRDLGGISGCAAATVTNCSVANVQITADQTTNAYGAKDVNAGDLIGRDTGAVQSGNTAENVSYTFIGCVNNKTVALNAQTATLIKDVSASAVGISVSGAGELILENVTVAASAEGVSGLALEADSNVKVTVVGSVSLTGAKNGEGIRVPGSAVIEITGAGSLTAVGNAGKEYSSATGYQTEDTEYESSGASGIGYAGQAVGKIYIHDLAGLTAEGYGVHAFGIGGNITSDLSLENVTSVASVRGGFAQALCLADEKYGKSEPEGGAAIGVGTDATAFGISLKNVAIVSAKGGSKAAGIGAQHHTKAVISITGCTIESVTGGNASAGIGGSRVAENTGSDRSGQTISITIADSTITAQGGQFGAGIGSGYDTYCTQGDLAAICTITITGDSKIAAKGGKYAAGIGTGYHASGLTGTIDAAVDTTGTASGEDFYKDTYTSAQAIGFGIVDPTRDGLNSTSSITVGDTVISIADAIAAIGAA